MKSEAFTEPVNGVVDSRSFRGHIDNYVTTNR